MTALGPSCETANGEDEKKKKKRRVEKSVCSAVCGGMAVEAAAGDPFFTVCRNTFRGYVP